jgi:hypothetical protein
MLAFVRKLVSDGVFKTEEAAFELPFSYLETLNQLNEIDHESFLSVLAGIMSGERSLTYRDLRLIYQNVRDKALDDSSSMVVSKRSSSMVVAKRASRLFQDKCMKLLHRHNIMRLDKEATFERMDKTFEFANPDFIVTRRHEARINSVEGVDCYLLQGSEQTRLIAKSAARVAFEASFFDRFWVAMHAHDADRLNELCKKLDVRNVGIIAVDNDVLHICKLPLFGEQYDDRWPYEEQFAMPRAAPYPDRRKLLYDHLGIDLNVRNLW